MTEECQCCYCKDKRLDALIRKRIEIAITDRMVEQTQARLDKIMEGWPR